MADRYRGTMYTSLTAHPSARIHQHQHGRGTQHCGHHELLRLIWAERAGNITALIAHDKGLKRWRREWKFEPIERGNTD